MEVQERLDGRLLIRHRHQVLTPQDTPALATQLRNRVSTGPVRPSVPEPDPTDWAPQRVRAPVIPGPLAGETIWYEDPARKQIHRDLVLAGMERARQHGKRIGRPRVSERPEFEQQFTAVAERIRLGGLSRRQAARELGKVVVFVSQGIISGSDRDFVSERINETLDEAYSRNLSR